MRWELLTLGSRCLWGMKGKYHICPHFPSSYLWQISLINYIHVSHLAWLISEFSMHCSRQSPPIWWSRNEEWKLFANNVLVVDKIMLVQYYLTDKMSQFLNDEKHYLYTIWLTLGMLPNFLNFGLLISEVEKWLILQDYWSDWWDYVFKVPSGVQRTFSKLRLLLRLFMSPNRLENAFGSAVSQSQAYTCPYLGLTLKWLGNFICFLPQPSPNFYKYLYNNMTWQILSSWFSFKWSFVLVLMQRFEFNVVTPIIWIKLKTIKKLEY